MTNHTFAKNQTDILSMVMRQVYLRMFIALLVTAFTAMFVASSPTLLEAILSNKVIFFGIIIAELALVIGLSAAIDKLSTPIANLMLLVYAMLNGVTLSSIFFIYTLGSIAYTFFIAAGVFLAMSIYGFVTKNNLNTFASYCIMGLFGIIIASLVNIFLGSDSLQWIISFVGVALFMGLTAWDTQKIKQASYYADHSQVGRLAVIGALSLYLDFINIFLYLLRFFGKRD
jgi:FtsH-binding integral membrane protein